MTKRRRTRTVEGLGACLRDAMDYQAELARRTVVFLDILRERANNMLAHERAGMPPPLKFEYEAILDARTFERPANYVLLRITGAEDDCAMRCAAKGARPVIVVDPRAGHGAGIGGFSPTPRWAWHCTRATPRTS